MKTQEEINQHWSDDSGDYDAIIKDELNSYRVEAWQKQIGSQVNFQKDLKVLDTGCGPAFFTIILAKMGYEVTGIDAAKGMLEKARANVAENQVQAEILEMDCHELDFPDNTFDLIVSRNVTHALRNHKQVYSEWLRVLKPGGTLLIFDANWHLASFSDEMHAESLRRWQECIRQFGSDYNRHTDPTDLSEWENADRTPHEVFGTRIRPDWDMGLLEGIGFSDITYERNIIEGLWDEKEKVLYGHTPMFMIKAQKTLY